jgi:hypothetical protein
MIFQLLAMLDSPFSALVSKRLGHQKTLALDGELHSSSYGNDDESVKTLEVPVVNTSKYPLVNIQKAIENGHRNS